MFESNMVSSSPTEKYKPIFLVLLLIVLGFVYFKYARTNENKTDVTFETSAVKDELYVDISGAVKDPGVYVFITGDNARLVDVIAKAGGILETANFSWVRTELNLAQKIEDTQKVYIPFEWEDNHSLGELIMYEGKESVVVESQNKQTNSSTNINSASQAELMQISGIGEVYSQAIIDGRPYGTVEDLITKNILSKKLFEKIKNEISL